MVPARDRLLQSRPPPPLESEALILINGFIVIFYVQEVVTHFISKLLRKIGHSIQNRSHLEHFGSPIFFFIYRQYQIVQKLKLFQ